MSRDVVPRMRALGPAREQVLDHLRLCGVAELVSEIAAVAGLHENPTRCMVRPVPKGEQS